MATTPDPLAPPPLPARSRGRRWLPLLILLVLAVGCVAFLLPPWIFHIGGRSTAGMSWDGLGTVQATNGGRYVLSAHLVGGVLNAGHGTGLPCSQNGCDDLSGTAKLCTRNGTTYTFGVTGDVHTWWSTDSARTSVDLTDDGTHQLPEGWVVAFSGAWHGPQLALSSQDNSFTEVFTPQGAARTTTSTADAGRATVTLHHGSAADFERACRDLAHG